MIEIIPAILPKSFKELEEHVARVHGFVKKVQVDVVDSRFARNKTWPYKDRGTFERIVKEEHGLPFWQELDFEFDLMIENPAEEVMNFVRAGASHVVVHAAAPGAAEGLQKLAELRLGDDGAFTVTTGLALLPDMQPDILEHFDGLYDYVQVMGIANVGRQGEPLEPHSFALIERLHKRYPALAIQVDGGVSLQTARQFVEAGASRLVVGSAIFTADNPEEAYKALYTEANVS
ncbi:MAG: hypothetical protein U1C66_02815 [Patescibacteria group bacterium]|nr:hypothetical protein [Patescibacteria group bacterium]